MTIFVTLLHWLISPFAATYTEALHVRLLQDWLAKPNESFIHPHCRWKIADRHPYSGEYEGRGIFEEYSRHIENTYPEWHQVVSEVTGSRIGGIVVGEYQYRNGTNTLWYTAPFTHFYRIQQGKIVGVRYYVGNVSIQIKPSRQPQGLLSLFPTYSLN